MVVSAVGILAVFINEVTNAAQSEVSDLFFSRDTITFGTVEDSFVDN